MNTIKYFICFLFIRLSSIILVRTSYVPDEYWQSTEVAHWAVYGNGYLTWEWRTGLRSYTYPSLFAFLFTVLKFLGLDTRLAIIWLPRCVQALFTAIGDVYAIRLSVQLFGEHTAKWTAFSLATSWFLFYCSSRTLTNTMETALTNVGFYYYHRWLIKSRRRRKKSGEFVVIQFLSLIGICVAVRPTAVVQWTPLCVYHLFKEGHRLSTWIIYSVIGLTTLIGITVIDYVFYGTFLCTTWNFVRFNVINDQGSFYGSHPWHWYWTQGFWITMGPHLVPFILELRRSYLTPIFGLILWQITIYSFLSHKEFRFLLPILTLCQCIIGRHLSSSRKNYRRYMMIFLVVVSLPVTLYTGLIHQRGTLDAVNVLGKAHELHGNLTLISFLMPCHSTPLYSHLHYNITTEFLTCDPDFNSKGIDYLDEADIFHADPEGFLKSKYHSAFPSHIVLFDETASRIDHFLTKGNYTLLVRLFHAHIVDGPRISKWVHIYKRMTNK